MGHNEIVEPFKSSIKSSNLRNLIEIGSEIGVDSILDNELLRDIPLFGILYDVYKTGVTIRQKIFAKKIYNFLYELKDIPASEREAAYQRIEHEETYRRKVGETLIMILDNSDEYKKTNIIGRLFKVYIYEEISLEKFMRMAQIVNQVYLGDLYALKESGSTNILNPYQKDHLHSNGLLSFGVGPPGFGRTPTGYGINIIGKQLIEYGLE